VATSATEIANSALVKIGAQRIADLADANERARLLNEQYAKVRDELLYSHPWNFAVHMEELALDATAPEFEWASRFPLPNNCLRVIGTDLPNISEWEVQGGWLMCNFEEVKIKYIKKEEDVTLYSPAFCEALASKLAADVSYSIMQSVTLKQALMQDAEVKLRLARSFDAQEKVGDRVYADTWLNSRA